MDTTFEQKVREKAYEIWLQAGMGDGQAHEHWVIAEAVVTRELGVAAPMDEMKPARPSKAKAPAKPKSTRKAPVRRASGQSTH